MEISLKRRSYQTLGALRVALDDLAKAGAPDSAVVSVSKPVTFNYDELYICVVWDAAIAQVTSEK